MNLLLRCFFISILSFGLVGCGQAVKEVSDVKSAYKPSLAVMQAMPSYMGTMNVSVLNVSRSIAGNVRKVDMTFQVDSRVSGNFTFELSCWGTQNVVVSKLDTSDRLVRISLDSTQLLNAGISQATMASTRFYINIYPVTNSMPIYSPVLLSSALNSTSDITVAYHAIRFSSDLARYVFTSEPIVTPPTVLM